MVVRKVSWSKRIAGGKFDLDGRSYSLAVNNGPNALHGGLKGLDQRVWDILESGATLVRFGCTLDHMEEGYPGRMRVEVTYSLRNAGRSVHLSYEARCEPGPAGAAAMATLVNLTNHSYFNLSGGLQPTVHQHRLQLYAGRYLELGNEMIPTGVVLPAKGPMDFQGYPRELGDSMKNLATGYDHCYVVDTCQQDVPFEITQEPRMAATLHCPLTEITMNFSTTEPGKSWVDDDLLSHSQMYSLSIRHVMLMMMM